MTEIKYEESKTAALSASPIPISSSRTSPRPFTRFELLVLYQTAWFPKVIILMFGMALVIASFLLFTVALDSYYLAFAFELISLFEVLCFTFGYYTLVLVVLISICLAIQFNCSRLPLWLWRWKDALKTKLNGKTWLIIQRSLWTTLLLSLLAASWVCFLMFSFQLESE